MGGDLPNNTGIIGFFITIWEMSMLGNAVSIEGPMGKSIGPTILAILPSILLYRKVDQRIWKILFFCILMLIMWYNGVQRARHLFPTIGLLSVISGYLINKMIIDSRKIGYFILSLALTCSIINLGPWTYVNFISINRLNYIYDNDLNLYLKTNLDKSTWYPNYEMTNFIRDELADNIKIAALSTGNSYYLNKPFYGARAILGLNFIEKKNDMTSDQFYKKMKDFGITHVFLNEHVIKNWNLKYSWLNREDFKGEYLNELLYYNNQTLFELK
jgi:hypothetical protein